MLKLTNKSKYAADPSDNTVTHLITDIKETEPEKNVLDLQRIRRN
jgi:hypothetical protein